MRSPWTLGTTTERCGVFIFTCSVIGMLWGEPYLDAVACEGTTLIHPIWLLCSERLYFIRLIQPAQDAAGLEVLGP